MSRFAQLAAVATVLFSSTLALAASLPDGCGPADTQYKVKLDKKAPKPSAGPTDQAQLVFVQALDGEFGSGPVSRFAVDGAWVGADKGASFFVVSVSPGTHQVCASRQSGIALERQNVGALKVDAQAGKSYFLAFKIKREAIGSPTMSNNATGVPGSSMTAKPQETVDSAQLIQLEPDAASTLVTRLPQALSEKK